LSREVIVQAALDCVRDSAEPLSLSHVGRRLAADPTAIYRHYRNRDELLRDLGDRIYGEALELAGADLFERPWRQMLSDRWWAVRRAYLRYPGLALEVAPRFTGGANERMLSTRTREALRGLGLDPVAAARHTRAIAETALGFIVITARLQTLPPDLQMLDTENGHRLYPEVVPAGEPPTVEEALADEDETFELALQTQLDGLAAAVEKAAAENTAARKGRRS
jgi:AcrR family transcriptional regulator